MREKAEKRIDKIITNRFDSLRTELNQELYLKDQSIKGFRQELEKMVVRLNEKAKMIERERQDNLDELMTEIKSGTNDVLKEYNEEMKVRRTNDSNIRDVVREIIDRVDSDLGMEKKERTNNEDEMLEMMDGVCNRIASITQ